MNTDKNTETKQQSIPSELLTFNNENQLRKHYFKVVQTTAINHHIPFKPRFLNKIYADICGYFWLNCHLCNNKFGGHEWYGSENMVGVCPSCTLKHFNKTGKFDNNQCYR